MPNPPNPKHNIHHSSQRQDWATPTDIYEDLNQRYGPFTLDAAASAENAKCARYWTEADDALTKPWTGRTFCNPPYQYCAKFVERAIDEARNGNAEIVVLLVPARTDTRWFREAWEHADEVRFLSGRIAFEGASGPAPFPSSAIVLRRPATWASAHERVTYTMPTRHGTRPRWFIVSGGSS